eukprot:767840_1
MGHQLATTYSFCCTACSACPCCAHIGYDQLDKLGLMKNTHGMDYQSNGSYDVNKIKTQDENTMTKQKSNNNNNIHVKDERTKFRSFIIAYNKRYGYLLLRAYKKGKDLHYQLPGGHIDKSELHGCSFENAAKLAAKRELFEETGLNINDNSRLKNLKLNINDNSRVYFQLLLKDTDSLSNEYVKSLDDKQDFYLKIDPHEHNGFVFEKDINKAIDMIKKHSGGKNSEALSLYATKAKHERKRSHSHSRSKSIETSSNSHKIKNKKEKRKRNKNKHNKVMSV